MTELPDPKTGCTYYGVTLYELGEGDYLVAFGTHRKLRFLAACNAYAKDIWNSLGLFDGEIDNLVEDVQCFNAEFVRHNEYDWQLSWGRDNLNRDVPITALTLQ